MIQYNHPGAMRCRMPERVKLVNRIIVVLLVMPVVFSVFTPVGAAHKECGDYGVCSQGVEGGIGGDESSVEVADSAGDNSSSPSTTTTTTTTLVQQTVEWVGGGEPVGTPYNVVGSTYSTINPSQECVDRSYVERFINMLKSGIQPDPIEIWFFNNGIWIIDGHHRFVASMMSGIQIRAVVIGDSDRDTPPNSEFRNGWSSVTYCEDAVH